MWESYQWLGVRRRFSPGFLKYLQLASHELATISINVTKEKFQIQIHDQPGMWESYQWRGVRRRFSQDTLVSSLPYNRLVTPYPQYGRKKVTIYENSSHSVAGKTSLEESSLGCAKFGADLAAMLAAILDFSNSSRVTECHPMYYWSRPLSEPESTENN